jgi:hypothetical protein
MGLKGCERFSKALADEVVHRCKRHTDERACVRRLKGYKRFDQALADEVVHRCRRQAGERAVA